jgi:hypothetical protein
LTLLLLLLLDGEGERCSSSSSSSLESEGLLVSGLEVSADFVRVGEGAMVLNLEDGEEEGDDCEGCHEGSV